jgi:hypothetical protein
MHLDVLTLIVAGSFVALISAVVLSGAWLNMSRAPALMWWAAAMYVYGAGIACIAFGVAVQWPTAIVEGNFLSAASTTLIWAGVRTFHARRTYALLLIAACFAWSSAVSLLIGADRSGVSLVAGFSVSRPCFWRRNTNSGAAAPKTIRRAGGWSR